MPRAPLDLVQRIGGVWQDEAGRSWDAFVPYTVLDHDVAEIDVATSSARSTSRRCRLAAGEASAAHTAGCGSTRPAASAAMRDPDPAPISASTNDAAPPRRDRSASTGRAIVRPNHGLTSGEVRKSPECVDRNGPVAKKPPSGS